MAAPMLGGIKDLPENENSAEIDDLARFAVQEHNKKQVPIFCLYFDEKIDFFLGETFTLSILLIFKNDFVVVQMVIVSDVCLS